MPETLVTWANENGGLISLIGLVLAILVSIPIFHAWFRIVLPTTREKERRLNEEQEHVLSLKREFETKTECDEMLQNYGDFVLCDDLRKLYNTDQNHSPESSPHMMVCLERIRDEHLEFTQGAMGIKDIKNIAGHWHFCDGNDEDAVCVEEVLELPFGGIARVRWDSNDYWEDPIICCRFNGRNEFPISRRYYAEVKELAGRRTLLKVCTVNDVYPEQK